MRYKEDKVDSEYLNGQEIKEGQYKNKIHIDLLLEFLMVEEEELGQIHIEEVYKVINIVLRKYYSKYVSLYPDLRASCFETMLNRRGNYNPQYSPYTYLYTQARNELGNLCYRWSREQYIDDQLSYKEPGLDQIDFENTDTPVAFLKYLHYFTGEADYTIKRIARKDVPDIIIYLKLLENKAVPAPPEYFNNKKNISAILYKLLKDIISA